MLPNGTILHLEDALLSSRSNKNLISFQDVRQNRYHLEAFLQRIQGGYLWPNTPTKWSISIFYSISGSILQMIPRLTIINAHRLIYTFTCAVIKLQTHFSEYNIKSIRMDNAKEFTSKSFNEYCASLGIEVEPLVPHVHTQNGLA